MGDLFYKRVARFCFSEDVMGGEIAAGGGRVLHRDLMQLCSVACKCVVVLFLRGHFDGEDESGG